MLSGRWRGSPGGIAPARRALHHGEQKILAAEAAAVEGERLLAAIADPAIHLRVEVIGAGDGLHNRIEARRVVREVVPGPGEDRHLSPEIEAVVEVVRSGRLAAEVAAVTGLRS